MRMHHCNFRWTDEYLEAKMGTKKLTVDITPHGLGDAVLRVQSNPAKKDGKIAAGHSRLPAQDVEHMFVKPLEMKMQMREFFKVRALIGLF